MSRGRVCLFARPSRINFFEWAEKSNLMVTQNRSVAKASSKLPLQRRMFFKSSGLDPSDFETKRYPEEPYRIYIVYRNPVTDERMKAPNGKTFRRCRILNDKEGVKYRTRKDGGVHLYFPSCSERGNVVDCLKSRKSMDSLEWRDFEPYIR